MATIEEQLALEEEMVSAGIARYYATVNSNNAAGRGSENDYAIAQIRDILEPMSEELVERCTRTGAGRLGRVVGLLRGTEYKAACFISLQQFFNDCAVGEAVLTTLCGKIGTKIEDDIKFKKFRKEHPGYVDSIIADFKRKGTQNYRHKHRVLTKKAAELDVQWNSWTERERVHCGLFLIDCLLLTSDAAVTYNRRNGNKTYKYICMSDDLAAWIGKNKDFMSKLHPDAGPCVIQPAEWTDTTSGGFYHPRMQRRFPMVKTHNKAHRRLLSDSAMPDVLAAVNRAQGTAWRVNTRVLSVVSTVWTQNMKTGMPSSQPVEIPERPAGVRDGVKQADMPEEELALFRAWKSAAAAAHGAERERRSKLCLVSRALATAEKHKDRERLWFVYQCDFRGRMYPASPGFSPQGSDQAKGLLHFADAVKLTEKGFYWLKVHAANKYGYDKGTYAERAEWVDENKQDILMAAENPIGHRAWWGSADKPYQFLAACFELADAWNHPVGPGEYESRIPVARDGTCNGLQNFSALLRDKTGGTATNLTPNDRPADIYASVAEVLKEKLNASDDPLAARWLKFGIDRALCKKPVMTLPYGSTRVSCADSIMLHVYKMNSKRDEDFFGKETWSSAQFLTPLLWDSIGEVVVAARGAMAWLQECSRILAKQNVPFAWRAPNGFPVYQASPKFNTEVIQTLLLGFLKNKLTVYVNVPTTELDPRKQASGSAPNFVHSLDASHMMAVINNCGLTSLAMVHDDFGCHAAYVDEFDKCIRESFVSMYDGRDIIRSLHRQFCKQSSLPIPNPPGYGDLDIKDVLRSEYFFG